MWELAAIMSSLMNIQTKFTGRCCRVEFKDLTQNKSFITCDIPEGAPGRFHNFIVSSPVHTIFDQL